MTKEEAIKGLKSLVEVRRKYVDMQTMKDEIECLEMAIKVLEQHQSRCDSCIHSEEQDGSNCYECVKGMADNFEAQPCEDCISRKAVKKQFEEVVHNNGSATEFLVRLWKLQPVQPTRPTGRWKRIHPQGIYECSECGINLMTEDIECYEYCHSCGAKMAESEDSGKINCKTTKCENCKNHNYCDYEPRESEDKE